MKREDFLILIVDDYLQNVQVLGRILESNGFNIGIAHNGRSALKLVDEVIPDLILLDVTMPDICGYEVCKKLKERNETKEVPIIFLTARSEVEDIEKGYSCGGDDFLHKPFNMDELLRKVEVQLELVGLRRDMKKVEIEAEIWKRLYIRLSRKIFKHLRRVDLEPFLVYRN